MAPDFAFGPFNNYITGGDMPTEAQLSELQRRWDDIATIIEALSTCGVSQLLDVQFKVEEKKPEQPKPAAAPAEVSKPAAAKVAEPIEKKPSFFSKVLYFVTHEILFSIGLLVCLCGLIYFFIALIKTSNVKKKKKESKEEDKAEEAKAGSEEESKNEEAKPEEVPEIKTEAKPAKKAAKKETKEAPKDFGIDDEEDEFLRALLGDNKK